jgi:bis(5'-nucleosyl)-tetraphosphatase (symmetrical)
MSTYAIGDVQGCYQELEDLLDKINFDNNRDRLWFTGDLVNRGPESLATLRFAKQINATATLGNHECHLLAIANGVSVCGKKDTLDEILSADDVNSLINWIRYLPLIYFDDESSFVLIHAGLPPQWDIKQAIALAGEVESVLQSDKAHELLLHMYGDQPDKWNEDLSGFDRLRFIINVFTRMRFCKKNGQLNFKDKGPPGTQTRNSYPWFELENRKTRNNKIIFGHWASLTAGNTHKFHTVNVYPLDTGCVWGRELTAMRLEDGNLYVVPSRQKPKFD